MILACTAKGPPLAPRHPKGPRQKVAQIYDFSFGAEGRAHAVMEFVDGVTLREYLTSGEGPDLSIAVEIAVQTLDALSYLHGQGFVHRDIAPDNLMLARGPGGDPRVKMIVGRTS